MSHREMSCSISDGLQYDDWLEGEPEEDEDEQYEISRQQEIDDEQS